MEKTDSSDTGFAWISESGRRDTTGTKTRRRVKRRFRKGTFAQNASVGPLSEEHLNTEYAYKAPKRTGELKGPQCENPLFPNMSKRRYDFVQTIIRSATGPLSTTAIISAVIANLKPNLRRLHRGYIFLSKKETGLLEGISTGNDKRERAEIWWSEDEEFNYTRLPKRPSSSKGGPLRPNTFKYRYPLREYLDNNFFDGLRHRLFGWTDPKAKQVTLVMDGPLERVENLELPPDGRRVKTTEWEEYAGRYKINDMFDVYPYVDE